MTWHLAERPIGVRALAPLIRPYIKPTRHARCQATATNWSMAVYWAHALAWDMRRSAKGGTTSLSPMACSADSSWALSSTGSASCLTRLALPRR